MLKPSWEAFEPAADDVVIELDPGMAFGTGLHPSTRLCIAALEQLVQAGDTVLDVGTGSGVLSIVAVKMGATTVYATDIDPIAVDVAKENFRINGVQPRVEAAAGQGEASPRVEVVAGSVPAGMAGRFDVIVANILAEVLAGLLDSAYGNVPLAEPLAHGGYMILAGIIEEKAHLVVDACERHGLALVDTLQEADWVALVMRRA